MTTFSTSREIPASPEAVFAAMVDPVRLSRWWGPKGFTNTFDICEIMPGGRWVFTMHGPDGKDYANQNTFVEVDSPRKWVVRHVCEPTFLLTILLTASTAGTLVSWTQILDDADFARGAAHIIVPANEDNLDRLAAEVAS